MIYKAFFMILLSGLTLSCNQQSDTKTTNERLGSAQASFKLTGKIKYPETGLVLLEEYEQKDIKVVDTLVVSFDTVTNAETGKPWIEGEFDHMLEAVDPGYYRLNFYNKQMVNLILTGVDLNIEVDGNAPRGRALVTGSQDMELLNDINQTIQQYQLQVSTLNQQFGKANAERDEALMEELRGQFMELNTVHKNTLKNKIRAMGNSLAVLQVVSNLTVEEDFELLDSLGNLFAANPPDEKHTKDFLAYINGLRTQRKDLEKVQIGKVAPEINLPDPNGNMVSLSSLRGKVVLVDFWAQWCKPCRMENPNIVAAYNKYKGQGFEVFGVSLDRSKEQWIRGIEEDGLAWTQVSDLKYWKSAAAQTYGVRAIPASFLLDKNGIIIAKNLRGPALQAKLKEVLG